MKIGFYLKWNKGSIDNLKTSKNVFGDELFAQGMCTSLRKIKGVESAEIYAPNFLPEEKLDYMLYLNDTPPIKNLSQTHIAYVQNVFDDSENKLKEFQNNSYAGYLFISKKMLEMHKKAGFEGQYLPFSVDTNFFKPQKVNPKLVYDVSYVGNDIKGTKRTEEFILPAVNYNFGLYGNWGIPLHRKVRMFLKGQKMPEYKKIFAKLYKGKIPQELVPSLYTSSKINLNCSHQTCIDLDIITLRCLEILSCDGFLITDKVPSAETEFKGKAVFTGGGEQLKDQIRYYIDNESERKKISKGNHSFIVEKHSMDTRMKFLYNYLKKVV
ncbi:MAG: glycosyltransferase [archaeon]|jgi:spore maturation protein CgeB